MRKYNLTITLIQPTSRETVVHKGFYPFQFFAILAAWWYARNYDKLVRLGLFQREINIKKHERN